MKALLLSLALCACTFAPIDAKPEARNWAAEMGYKVQGVSCSGRDSDGDGYVSCSVKPVDMDPIAVECAYIIGNGCKMTQAIKLRGGVR